MGEAKRRREGRHSTDPALAAALDEDAAKLTAMGADPGPTLRDIEHRGLPVAGYAATQSAEAVDLVNNNKRIEEIVLRVLDDLRDVEGIDPRWLQMGRSHIESGFMFVNRAIFKPGRVRLPSDEVAS